MVSYPIVLEKDGDTTLAMFPDFPEAQTFGEDREEARLRAPDALATIIDAYIRDRRELPAPSRLTGEMATLSALMSAKVELYRAMRAAHVSKSELARRLDWHLPQVDRLLDLRHSSQLDQLEAAARALDGQLEVALVIGVPAVHRSTVRRPRRKPTRRQVRTARV